MVLSVMDSYGNYMLFMKWIYRYKTIMLPLQ